MKNVVVEEIEELGKGSDSSLRRKPNLCRVHGGCARTPKLDIGIFSSFSPGLDIAAVAIKDGDCTRSP